MTAFDDIFVPLASDEIADAGISATLFTYTASYDRTTGTNTRTETSTSVVVLPPSRTSLRFVDGDVVKVGDAQTLLASQGLSVTPKRGSKLTVSGQTWEIVRVDPLISGESTAAWKLFLRGE